MQTACAIALHHCWVSDATLIRLVNALGSPQAVWEASPSSLEPYVTKAQLKKLTHGQATLNPEALFQQVIKKEATVMGWWETPYPLWLREIYDPPFLLYVKGRMEAVQHRPLAVVGTRRFTDYGQRALEKLIDEIVPFNPCIVSGLASGIDTLAHHAALRHRLATVAVFGTGIDKVFPSENAPLAFQIVQNGGALVSEFPLGTSGNKYTFPKRNRVIAGLSQGVLVVEGSPKSGALITARAALEEGRHVMAVPGNIFSPAAMGPNILIQEGASPVQTGQDIALAMGWDASERKHAKPAHQQTQDTLHLIAALSPNEQKVFSVIGYEPVSFEEIQTKRSDLSVTDLQTALTLLELQGFVHALPGAKFSRN